MTEKKRLLFDAPLAWKVYDHIAAHPQEWNQCTWMTTMGFLTREGIIQCGTKACYAGNLAIMAAPEGTKFGRHEMLIPHGKDTVQCRTYESYAIQALSKGTIGNSHWYRTDEEEDLAQMICMMFSGENSLENLKMWIEELEAKYPSV